MKSDIFRIYLDSENATTNTASVGEYNYTLNIPTQGVNYKEYKLYVDDFNVCLKGLATTSVLVKLNTFQYSSFNSRTESNNNVFATVFNPNTATGRTSDLALNYQNPNTPYIINSLPTSLKVNLVDIDNAGIDFSNANNFWTLNLRVEAIIEGC